MLIPLSLLASTLIAPCAFGQAGQDRARAEALFRDAKRLKDAENYEEACPKFAASQKLDPALGTLRNLADCHEQQGLTASAWAEFLEAATLARRSDQAERADVASERAKALEGRLVRLKIVVKQAAQVDGLEIRQDGSQIDSATWNTAVPIDPGPHLRSVSAPGKKEWAKAFDASGEGETITLEVPALEDAPVEVAPPETPAKPSVPQPQPPPSEPPSNAQRTAGIILTGAGVIGLAVGGVFGLSAKNKWADADCTNGKCPTSDRQTLAEDAKSQANVSTLFFAAGGVLSTLGILLFATAPSAPEKAPTARLRVTPSVGPQGTGVWLGGAF